MPNNIEIVVIHPDKLSEMMDKGVIINTGTRVSIPSLGLKNCRLMQSRSAPVEKCALANVLGVVHGFVPFPVREEVIV